jgi:hypothetical protein
MDSLSHLKPLVGHLLLLLCPGLDAVQEPVLEYLASLLSQHLQHLSLRAKKQMELSGRASGCIFDVATVLFASGSKEATDIPSFFAFHEWTVKQQQLLSLPHLTFQVPSSSPSSLALQPPPLLQVQPSLSATRPSYWEKHLPEFPSAHTFMHSEVWLFMLCKSSNRDSLRADGVEAGCHVKGNAAQENDTDPTSGRES